MALSRRERREQRWKLLKQQRHEELKAAEQAQQVFEKKEYTGLLGIYDKYYLHLLIIPIVILLLAFAQLGYQYYTTGEFIQKGVALKGGVTITIPVASPVDIELISSFLSERFPGSEMDVRSATELGTQKAIIIATDQIGKESEILSAMDEKIPGASINSSSETTGAALGSSFFQETITAMIFAFVFMALVVFFAFRTFAPSMMVIIAVIADILETVAAANLIGLKFSGAGIAALLMLIGYSVDTDILLTTRVLKNKDGTVFRKIIGAAKTGLMMTATALIAVIISLILTQNETIKEIMIIMVFGLSFDIINTWLQNTALLRYYMEKIRPGKIAAKHAKEEEQESERIEDEIKEAEDLGIEIDEDRAEPQTEEEGDNPK